MVFRYGTAEEAGMCPERVKRVERLVQGWVEKEVSPAIVMFMARKSIVVSHKAFGKQGPEAGSPVLDVDTLYPLASMTKPITATCIMILQEQGLVDLNRPVCEYIPEFASGGKKEVKLYHLLTHTSGITDDVVWELADSRRDKYAVPGPDANQNTDINQFLNLTYDVHLTNQPGKFMSYCNYGYNMLGEVVRRVSGKSIDDFARENIFEPLGMNSTFYIVPDSEVHRVIRRKPSEGHDTDWYTGDYALKTPWAAGGVYSTVMDMAIFGQMFLNKGIYNGHRILSPATVAEMTRDQTPGISAVYGNESFDEACWGYGWNVKGKSKKDLCGSLRSEISFNHGGNGGVSFWIDPVYKTVSVYFSVDAKQNIDLYCNAVLAAVVEE